MTEEMRESWEKFIKISKNSVDFNFRTWFVGFVEGLENKAFVRKGFDAVYFELKLPRSEFKVIEYIKEGLKPLNIQTFVILTKNKVSLKITEPWSLAKILGIFSGSIFLREYFDKVRFWVAVFRYLFDIHILFFKKTIQNLPRYNHMWLTQTSWLSGFLDARVLFTNLIYFKSYNHLEVARLEGKIIVPMKISREIKLFENLAKIYGGTIKITEETTTRKFYYCLDIKNARKLGFYIRGNPLKTTREKYVSFLLNIMLQTRNIIAERAIFICFNMDGKERTLVHEMSSFNVDLAQSSFFFTSELREVWQTIFSVRAEKRAKARGGEYANFLENKYQYVYQLKPKTYIINLNKPVRIFFIIHVLLNLSEYTIFRKGPFRLIYSPVSKHNMFIVDFVDNPNPLNIYGKRQVIFYLVDKTKTIANRFKTALDTFKEAQDDLLYCLKHYDTVSDCEVLVTLDKEWF